MAKGVIGKPFTFRALFRDSVNDPVTPISPIIEVFYFDDLGTKVNIVPTGTALPAQVPAEIGRYTFTVTLPTSLDPRYQVYGVMVGADPGSGDDIVIEQEVDLFSEENPGGSGASSGGLGYSFVKPGQC